MRRRLPPPPRGYSWPEVPRRLRSSVERARWDTEADMFRAFVLEARAHGFRPVPEACGHDLLLVAGPRAGEGVRRQWHTALDAETTDPWLDKLRSATPDEIRTYVDVQVTDLATAKVALKKLAVAVAYTLKGERDK